MRKYILIIMLTFFAFAATAQNKMTIRTCTIQYGDVMNYNLNDVVMEGDPLPYVTKFQLTKDYFIELTKDGKFKYNYASTSDIGLKTNEDFRIKIKDENLQDYNVEYSYENQTLIFYYSDGDENLRLTRFTVDNIKIK